MSDPWLTIIGLGEDGAQGLSTAAREALEQAEVVIGAPRHLALLPALTAQCLEWPVPFADGIARLIEHRGRRVVMLASGDPFWFGAGAIVARHLDPGEWVAHPAPSTFTLAAARLGWALQDTVCLGLHAAPLARLRPHLAPRRSIIALMRDGAQVEALRRYLVELGFGASLIHVMEALGGPRERIRCVPAQALDFQDITHPVAVGIATGAGPAIPVISGLPDDLFASDGQITKRPIRALTLSALAPRAGETLWDIGAGSGSIGIEWLLAHPANRALAIEADPVRAARARANAADLGVDHLQVIEGRAPETWPDGPPPDAVFIGGGLSEDLLSALWSRLPAGTRLVANAVTLESESLLARWHGRKGGALLRVELADAAPIGTRHGWKARYPLVQWSVTL
ncbi:precorrin-6y C5,15-methyltransferase (decarboxylating) subunit CbiE [Novosphingobium sp. SG707]|uniref:precorrin-6y C5,15-methyltransferase (decarboxylating) subunit CbiE n=1 Tax=Novosphingobium sp. SG707 TaxID=2586996 RepID=UPI001445830A|nr:precorrin-6y C5,15-methyltransferase (decarboxylating) subunit CbiE [Novosphingobium sp. SG707]NKI98743.1 precorrin-6Y C5,15-methyltransferase (decarboxylating) [Novosphingobium sp. SG707]